MARYDKSKDDYELKCPFCAKTFEGHNIKYRFARHVGATHGVIKDMLHTDGFEVDEQVSGRQKKSRRPKAEKAEKPEIVQNQEIRCRKNCDMVFASKETEKLHTCNSILDGQFLAVEGSERIAMKRPSQNDEDDYEDVPLIKRTNREDIQNFLNNSDDEDEIDDDDEEEEDKVDEEAVTENEEESEVEDDTNDNVMTTCKNCALKFTSKKAYQNHLESSNDCYLKVAYE